MIRFALAFVVGLFASAVAPKGPTGLLALLLAEGRITLVDVASGREVATYAASDRPSYGLSAVAPGQLTQSGDDVWAILPDAVQFVAAAIDVRTFKTRQLASLPTDQYRALVVGSRTGTLFAFGSMGVTSVSPKTREVQRVVAFGDRQQIAWGAVSSDEHRIYASYHGRGTGVEWFDETADGWKSAGRLMSHGNFVLLEKTLLVATGDAEILEADARGYSVRRLDTRLTGNHLMEFAVDRRQETIYAIGSCVYSGGFTATPLKSGGAARVIVPVRDYSVCGDRLSLSPQGDWLAVAVLMTGGPPSEVMRRVRIVGTESGQIVRTITATSEVIDVLAVR